MIRYVGNNYAFMVGGKTKSLFLNKKVISENNTV